MYQELLCDNNSIITITCLQTSRDVHYRVFDNAPNYSSIHEPITFLTASCNKFFVPTTLNCYINMLKSSTATLLTILVHVVCTLATEQLFMVIGAP